MCVQTGATGNERPAEKQEENKTKELRITVIFSILSKSDLEDKNGELDDATTLFNKPHSVNTLVWEHGLLASFKQNKLFFINCDSITIDEDTYQCPDTNTLLAKVIEAVLLIENYCRKEKKENTNLRLHFTIAAFFPIEGMLFALASILKKKLPNSDLYSDLISLATNEAVTSHLTEYTSNGSSATVDHVCLYENYDLYIHRNYDLKAIFNCLNDNWQQQEFDLGNVTVTREQLLNIFFEGVGELPTMEQIEFYDSLPPYWNGDIGPRGEIVGKSDGGKGALMFIHLGLGFCSLIPVAGTVFSLLDATLHIAEFTVDGDPTHWRDAGIDVVCAIPFVSLAKIGKLAKGAKELKAMAEAANISALEQKAVRLGETGRVIRAELKEAEALQKTGTIQTFKYSETITVGNVTAKGKDKYENVFQRVQRLRRESKDTANAYKETTDTINTTKLAINEKKAELDALKTEAKLAAGIRPETTLALRTFNHYRDYFKSIPKIATQGSAIERIDAGLTGFGIFWVGYGTYATVKKIQNGK